MIAGWLPRLSLCLSVCLGDGLSRHPPVRVCLSVCLENVCFETLNPDYGHLNAFEHVTVVKNDHNEDLQSKIILLVAGAC